ncbi:hypothetical protein C8R45DRAFT_1176535 [Mycena sanguinolenta]|nr:hypothetical protein C8R45DRAFT_1176535 [Mycena sanguinolenta]
MHLNSSLTIALLALDVTTAVGATPAPTPVPAIPGLTCIVDSHGFGLNLVNDGGSTTDKGGPPGEGTGVIVDSGPNSQINQEVLVLHPQGSNFLIANGLNSSLFLSYPALPFGGGNPVSQIYFFCYRARQPHSVPSALRPGCQGQSDSIGSRSDAGRLLSGVGVVRSFDGALELRCKCGVSGRRAIEHLLFKVIAQHVELVETSLKSTDGPTVPDKSRSIHITSLINLRHDFAGVVVYSRYPATFSFQTVTGGVRIVEVISGTALTSWSGPVTLARIGTVPASQQTWTLVAAQYGNTRTEQSAKSGERKMVKKFYIYWWYPPQYAVNNCEGNDQFEKREETQWEKWEAKSAVNVRTSKAAASSRETARKRRNIVPQLMPTTLIVGATRGLGAALALGYAHAGHTVYATARAASPPTSPAHPHITWIPSIDISTESAGPALAAALPPSVLLDIVVICAGYFVTESFDEEAGGVKFAEEVQMYKTCAVGPTHASEGGGNYAHHASKAALNMVGKLLSLDLRERGVAVGVVHSGFMRTDMTKNVGYDAYWDSGGAVDPATAAASLLAFVDSHVTTERSGEFWAVRGIRDVGTFEPVMRDLGNDLPAEEDKDKPVRLPW